MPRRIRAPGYVEHGDDALCLVCGCVVGAGWTAAHNDWHAALLQMRDRVATLADRAATLKDRVDANTAAITDLTTRVSALEHPTPP